MDPTAYVCAVFLVYLCQLQGTSTGTPVFVQTGKDLFLEVNKPVTPLLEEEGSDFRWRLNDSTNIVKFANSVAIIFFNFKDRAEFNKENYTLVLKNVQKEHNGDYTAQVSGQEDHPVGEYKVTVIDPVSPVKLEVNSSNPCNFTVTCSTTDSHISSTYWCVNQTCSQEGGEGSEVTTYPSIQVYLERGFIICNHRNQVSLEKDKMEIKPLCETKETKTALNAAIAIPIATGLATILALVCLGLYIIYTAKNVLTPKSLNTAPYGSQYNADINPAQLLNQNHTPDASSSPTSTYCLVQFHTGPEPRESTTHDPSLPETVYAQVDRSAKTKYKSPNNQHKS